jgi:N-dimethylarginine dimethylaminohydrolase
MNWVCLGPNEVLMPAGCPDTQARLRAAGVEVYETDVSEYLKAGGALGCLMGILERR